MHPGTGQDMVELILQWPCHCFHSHRAAARLYIDSHIRISNAVPNFLFLFPTHRMLSPTMAEAPASFVNQTRACAPAGVCARARARATLVAVRQVKANCCDYVAVIEQGRCV